MVFWIVCAIGLILAYLLGSIPTGYWAGRLLRGIDIREHGSRSTGATNALRTLGPWPALVVLLVDVTKGAAAVLLIRWLIAWLFMQTTMYAPVAIDQQSLESWGVFAAGLAALLGHGRSIWLRFTGGKSAATGLGVLLAMSPVVGLGVALVFGTVLAISRIVSLSSILAALAALALVLGLDQPLPFQMLVIAGGIYVIMRHVANIRRLLAGNEPRLGQKAL
jgi:glycerol-3-phosphate acyltransferase PlsY